MIAVEKLIVQLEQIIRNRIASDRLAVPALPATATRCITLLKDPDVDIKRLIALLETDPVYAALVVRAASTVSAGGAARSIEQAVLRVGTDALRTLLLHASARSLFESPDSTIRHRLAQVWRHTVAVAVLARDVAALIGATDVEVCYLAGLFHDIGKPIVAGLLLEVERDSGKRDWISGDDWSRVVDTCHRSIGVALAEKWALPPEVVVGVRDCVEYDDADRQSAANVVIYCNGLAKINGFAAGAFDAEDARAVVLIGRSMLDVDDAVVERLMSRIKDRTEVAP